MRSSLRISSFFRTHLRVHYSWILAFILITWAVTTQFSTDYPFWIRIASGAIASVSFFLAITFRELVLILMSIYKGIEVKSVTLFSFGGLIEVDQETTSPQHEVMIAISGILGNLAITGIFYIANVLLPETIHIMVDIVTKWLAFLYFALTIFHIIPAYPLEGGHFLRAILWKMLGDVRRSTQIAVWISWVLGIIIAIGGILILVFTIEHFTGVFLLVIGLILNNAATYSHHQIPKVTATDTGTDDQDKTANA
ncbi:hypothetical protein ACFLX8_04635 [Chloroflexota bacterium]